MTSSVTTAGRQAAARAEDSGRLALEVVVPVRWSGTASWAMIASSTSRSSVTSRYMKGTMSEETGCAGRLRTSCGLTKPGVAI